jgi:hypothetical protein
MIGRETRECYSGTTWGRGAASMAQDPGFLTGLQTLHRSYESLFATYAAKRCPAVSSSCSFTML